MLCTPLVPVVEFKVIEAVALASDALGSPSGTPDLHWGALF